MRPFATRFLGFALRGQKKEEKIATTTKNLTAGAQEKSEYEFRNAKEIQSMTAISATGR